MLPAGHAYPAVQRPLQAAEGSPVVLPKVPAGQLVHVAAPAKLYRPVPHAEGVTDVDPAEQANLSAAFQETKHAMQRTVRSNHGQQQSAQVTYPAWQSPVQLATVIADVDPYLPPGQRVQEPAPPVLYSPAAHVDAVALVEPAGQKYLCGTTSGFKGDVSALPCGKAEKSNTIAELGRTPADTVHCKCWRSGQRWTQTARQGTARCKKMSKAR